MTDRTTGLFALVMRRARSRARSRDLARDDDYFDLDRLAGRMFDDYRQAVAEGQPRGVLAQIITGIAGCELAMSRARPLMSWGTEPDEVTGESVEHEHWYSGMLLLEVARAAAEGARWQGVRSAEFQTGEVAGALRGLAFAYAGIHPGWSMSVDELTGQRLADLSALGPSESLMTLARAHGYVSRPK